MVKCLVQANVIRCDNREIFNNSHSKVFQPFLPAHYHTAFLQTNVIMLNYHLYDKELDGQLPSRFWEGILGACDKMGWLTRDDQKMRIT